MNETYISRLLDENGRTVVATTLVYRTDVFTPGVHAMHRARDLLQEAIDGGRIASPGVYVVATPCGLHHHAYGFKVEKVPLPQLRIVS